MLLSCDVWSPKGGCGKSTISLTLAGALAVEGYRVLLRDQDAQRSGLMYQANAERLGVVVPFDVKASVSDAEADAFDVLITDHAPGITPVLGGQVCLMPVMPSFFDYGATVRGEAELREKGRKVLLVPNRIELNSAGDAAFLAQSFVGRPFLKKRNPAYKYAISRGLTIFSKNPGLPDVRAARREFSAVVDALVSLAAA